MPQGYDLLIPFALWNQTSFLLWKKGAALAVVNRHQRSWRLTSLNRHQFRAFLAVPVHRRSHHVTRWIRDHFNLARATGAGHFNLLYTG